MKPKTHRRKQGTIRIGDWVAISGGTEKGRVFWIQGVGSFAGPTYDVAVKRWGKNEPVRVGVDEIRFVRGATVAERERYGLPGGAIRESEEAQAAGTAGLTHEPRE